MKWILLIALIAIPILIFAFYWYEWRPSQAKSECHTYALEKAIKDSGAPNNRRFYDDDYNFRYNTACIVKA
jgi:hypothetical protein